MNKNGDIPWKFRSQRLSALVVPQNKTSKDQLGVKRITREVSGVPLE